MALTIRLLKTREEMGARAATVGARRIQAALQQKEKAVIVLPTGASQVEVHHHLVRAPNLAWSHVTAFHLDEYVGLAMDHPASFRRYLKERFVDQLPEPIGTFHYIDPNDDPAAECNRLNALIADEAVDVAFVGIGENGHLAFNDPPADFETEAPFLVVSLDEACRRQQVGEGWFDALAEVPRQAISMSIPQIMKAKTVVCSVPDARKANAIRHALEGPVTPDVPASILQNHPDCHVLLDPPAASQLKTIFDEP